MSDGKAAISWEPRVPKRKIRRLYETDASGIYDEELIDDVGFSLLARCESFLEAMEARRGRAKCHGCGGIIQHDAGHSKEAKARLLCCDACGWEVTWGEYFKSIHKKQLCGPDLESLFGEFVRGFPRARSARRKMVHIDRLLHGFHYAVETGPRRPAAVNLIEGRLWDVIEFLNELTYGEGSTSGMRETAASWREDVNTALRSWGQGPLAGPEEKVARQGRAQRGAGRPVTAQTRGGRESRSRGLDRRSGRSRR